MEHQAEADGAGLLTDIDAKFIFAATSHPGLKLFPVQTGHTLEYGLAVAATTGEKAEESRVFKHRLPRGRIQHRHRSIHPLQGLYGFWRKGHAPVLTV